MKLATCVAVFGFACALYLNEGIRQRESYASIPPLDTNLPCIEIRPEEIESEEQEEPEEPLAVRNFNPLNIKALKYEKWKGQVGTDKHGHAIFESYEYGVRAAAHILKNYWQRHNICTVSELVNRFAEGNREAYIRFICQKLKVAPDEKLDMVRRIPQLLRAMSHFESGRILPEYLFIPYDILAKL